MSNVTIGKLKEISRLIDEELKKMKDERLLAQLDALKSIIEHITANRKDKELLLNEDQQVDEQLVKNTLSGLKEIEKQFKGNKTWSALKTGAQFLFKPIQVLFKSKYSVGGWVALLALGFVAIIGCLFAGAATIAAYYPLCMFAISVGALGLLGCALFSDRVGGFVKSCFSKVKSLFRRASDQGEETEGLFNKTAEVVNGLQEIQEKISQKTLPASSTAQPVEPISEPLQQQSQETANHNSSGHRLSLASDSDESESRAHASVSSFGHHS